MLKAVIFDLDGVVADSHPIHEAAWKTLLVEQGLNTADLNLNFLYAGHSRGEILRHYLGAMDVSEMERLGCRKDELYAAAAHELNTTPGITRMLAELHAERILTALATSAGRARAHESLERFQITKYFSAIVTGEDARSAKPAPDIFLIAAAKLGVNPEHCVAVEDSIAGVLAARAAGMKCSGYAPAQRLAELAEAGADDLISEFPENARGYFERLAYAPRTTPDGDG
jgi:beta-phosphoglucomutase